MSPLVEIRDLTVDYRSREGGWRSKTRVIDQLNLDVHRGEVLGIVGESGSGKSTLAGAILGLIDGVQGSIRFDGTELIGLRGRARRPIQRQVQMVFQNPLLSLSPRRSIGWQLEEPLRVHRDLSPDARSERVGELLEALELSDAVRERYPHELSGGQAQRVVLARALTLDPTMIVFDEPTSALDVSVQAGVLNLLQRLRAERELTYIFITHDLAVARHISDRIAVMRGGKIVELDIASTVLDNPTHAYTQELLASSPAL